jgi:hypothetical protein
MKFGKVKVTLGSETDEELFSILEKTLANYDTKLVEQSHRVVGSQEIITFEAIIDNSKLIIISETYEGLSIKGPKEIVNAIKEQVFSSRLDK